MGSENRYAVIKVRNCPVVPEKNEQERLLSTRVLRAMRVLYKALSDELIQRIHDGFRNRIGGTAQEMLGLDEAVDAGTGQTEAAQQVEGNGEIVGLGAELGEMADVDTEELDFVQQAGEFECIEVGEVVFGEIARIEAVLVGIEVAGLGAGVAGAVFFGGRGGGRHGDQ